MIRSHFGLQWLVTAINISVEKPPFIVVMGNFFLPCHKLQMHPIKEYLINLYCFFQTEKKVKSSSIDVRGDSDRRRKERSKERGDSKCSRESSDSRKREKAQKEHKELKVFKDDK